MKQQFIKKNNLILLVLIVLSIMLTLYILNNNKEKIYPKMAITSIYNQINNYLTIKEYTNIYTYHQNKYISIGYITKNQVVSLEEYNNMYYKLNNFNGNYYLLKKDVIITDIITKKNNRYKNYIPFNQNIITKNITNFYDEADNLVYSIAKSYNLAIIIKDINRYGVEFNNRLLYIKEKDVNKIIDNKNTDLVNTNHIGVLNYHFFWDDETETSSVCNQVICHSKTTFKKHLDLIKEKNLLTIKMEELEMYIDGKINLPKSIVITIDDGWRAELGIKILQEYQMHGTLFLITHSYNPDNYLDNEYLEVHSHTDSLHEGNVCPGGQGGGIKCLPRDKILADLKLSREKLHGSTVLCYPFYEYNNYAIELVKEAGFTMAFAGENGNNGNYVVKGSNKYTLPRFVVMTTTTIDDLKNYFE